MKIVVCVKEVPDMESKFKIIDNQKVDESQIAFKMNDFDQYAVEAALQLKEKFGGEVIIVSAGPERAQKQVRQAFAMGADWGIQVTDPQVDAGDNFVVASALFGAIKSLGGVDLVLTGVQAEDDQAGVTCGMIADMMGIASCTNIVKLEVGGDKKTLTVNRELEGGLNEVLVIACRVRFRSSLVSTSRVPHPSRIMKAKRNSSMSRKPRPRRERSRRSRIQDRFHQDVLPCFRKQSRIIEGDAKQRQLSSSTNSKTKPK
jgi:electron transfer flavoprotein beta subunit